jgi:hypothetical protein
MRHTIAKMLILAGTACLAVAHADLISLSLTPSGGSVSGQQGQTVGWGFNLTNTSGYYAVISSSEYCQGTAFCGTGTTNSSALGTYIDFISANSIVVGPNAVELVEAGSGWISKAAPYGEVFDNGLVTGVGSFSIFQFAPPGTENGRIYLTYDVFSDSTLSEQIGLSQLTFADASVTVENVSVPEYDSLTLLMIMGVAVLLPLSFWAWRRRAVILHR